MKVIKIKTTKEQKRNLAILAKALLTRKFDVEFRMDRFARGRNGYTRDLNSDFAEAAAGGDHACATTCCAVGHSIFIPQLPKFDPILSGGWRDHAHRLFGAGWGDEFHFLFGPNWADNKSQFAARAMFFLKYGGIPLSFSADDRFPSVKPVEFNHWIK